MTQGSKPILRIERIERTGVTLVPATRRFLFLVFNDQEEQVLAAAYRLRTLYPF